MHRRALETLTHNGPGGQPPFWSRGRGTWHVVGQACMKCGLDNWPDDRTTATKEPGVLLSFYLLAFKGVPFCWLS